MGAGRYEVAIVNAKSRTKATRQWSPADLVKSVKWLKRMNAQGGDIYIRPLDGPELILAAGLDAQALEGIRGKGFAPAAVIQTAPGRFEAWVKLSDQALPEPLRTTALSGFERIFAKTSGYGRLAGFANQQSEASREGRQAYVLAQEATGKLAPAAAACLDATDRLMRERAAEKQRLVQVENERLAQVERQRLGQVETAVYALPRYRGRSQWVDCQRDRGNLLVGREKSEA